MKPDNLNGGKKKIMLALQGGGAHTAYVWGVMDRLLERDDIEIVGISGTSGGAMIAAVVACGLSTERDVDGNPLDDAGRRLLAKDLLKKFWHGVAAIGDVYLNPYRFTNPFHHSWNIDGMPVPVILNAMSLITSPYQAWSGWQQNPVAQAIPNSVMDTLNKSEVGPALYICATNVRTSQPRVFTRKDTFRVEHLLASACLPVADRAVKIGTEYYWDGGYVADPALAPLIEQHSTTTGDLVIVGVNPIVIKDGAVPPDTAWEIINRMNEVTFNASLISDIRKTHSVNELLSQVPADAPARQKGGKLYGKKEIFIHYIPPHETMKELGVASKSNTALVFLEHLMSLGRDLAQQWESGAIAGGGAGQLGISSDTNLEELFIDPYHWRASVLPSQPPYVAQGLSAPAVSARAGGH